MQLTNVIQNFYSDIGQIEPEIGLFTATDGSATSFVNTAWANLESPPEEDALKNRYVLVKTTTDGLTPQGKWSKISSYVDSTNTATIDTVTDAIQSGDVLMVLKQDLFPLMIVIDRINRALQNLGEIPIPDTSLTTVADQSEYSLPVAAKRKVLGVYIQGELGNSLDNEWTSISDYRIDPTAGGTAGVLIIPEQPTGRTLKIIYSGIHPTVNLYSDYISEYIHPKVISLATMIEALQWYNNQDSNQGANEYYVWLMKEKQAALDIALREFPIVKPTRSPKWFTNMPSQNAEIVLPFSANYL